MKKLIVLTIVALGSANHLSAAKASKFQEFQDAAKAKIDTAKDKAKELGKTVGRKIEELKADIKGVLGKDKVKRDEYELERIDEIESLEQKKKATLGDSFGFKTEDLEKAKQGLGKYSQPPSDSPPALRKVAPARPTKPAPELQTSRDVSRRLNILDDELVDISKKNKDIQKELESEKKRFIKDQKKIDDLNVQLKNIGMRERDLKLEHNKLTSRLERLYDEMSKPKEVIRKQPQDVEKDKAVLQDVQKEIQQSEKRTPPPLPKTPAPPAEDSKADIVGTKSREWEDFN